jgi:hypothetical protein
VILGALAVWAFQRLARMHVNSSPEHEGRA